MLSQFHIEFKETEGNYAKTIVISRSKIFYTNCFPMQATSQLSMSKDLCSCMLSQNLMNLNRL